MINYFEQNMKILNNSIDTLDEKTWEQVLKECVNCVKNGGKIIASGLGKNVPICEKFVGTLNSFSIPAYFMHTNTAVHGDLGIVNPNDIVFVLSKSGSTAESLLLAKYLKDRHANLWVLTCNDNCKLSCYSNKKIVLKLEHEGDLWNIAPNNSTTLFLIFLQGLAVELSNKLKISLEQFSKNHPQGGIGEKLRQQNNQIDLTLSSLDKTWIFDLDGTIVEHNGYLLYGKDVLLDGAKEFLNGLPKTDYVLILTARKDEYKQMTLNFLKDNNIRYDNILFNMPVGERVLINDKKPKGLKCSVAVNTERNIFPKYKINIED